MIHISQPFLEQNGNTVYLKSHIYDNDGLDEIAVFSTKSDYGCFFNDETADSFVVAMLMYAVMKKDDIEVDGCMSEQLYYTINNHLTNCISEAWWGGAISVSSKEIKNVRFEGLGVGCGCSLGVDSLAAIYSHIGEKCPTRYRITHLTYFNVGAMGISNEEQAHGSYEKDLQMVDQFSAEIGLPVVTVESNIQFFYKRFKASYDLFGLQITMAAALSLSKLFSKYIVASTYHLRKFNIQHKEAEYYLEYLASCLSTESTQFYVANSMMQRSDKVKSIADKELAQKYLYVCWKEIWANQEPNKYIAKIKDIARNCGYCDKCKRTLLILELLGRLDDFKSGFNMDEYNKGRDQYIGKVLARRKMNAFYEDISGLITETKMDVPIKANIYRYLYKIYDTYVRIINNKQ